MEGVETYHLILDIGHHLDLFDTLYVLSISRNLVFISKFDVYKFSFKFDSGCFSLYKKTFMIGFGILSDGLYKLNLDNLYVEIFITLHHNIFTRHSLINKCFACGINV